MFRDCLWLPLATFATDTGWPAKPNIIYFLALFRKGSLIPALNFKHRASRGMYP